MRTVRLIIKFIHVYMHPTAKLEELNLSHNPLKVIPVEVGNLELLSELGQWEIGIAFLSRLQRLHVAACLLSEWPPHVSSLQELMHLDLSHNSLKEVPAEVADLVALKTLLLSHNTIEMLAPDIYSMQNLEVLDLSHNLLKKLPEPPPSNLALDPPALCMEKLVDLDLSHNSLEVLDDLLGIFANLEKFDASHNQIQMFHGEAISKLTALSILDLSHNSLEFFPEGLKCCVSLKHIKVTHNKLVLVPEQLMCATKLRTIDFSYNEIVDAAGRIFAVLSDLRRLDLHHNQIGPLNAMLYTQRRLEHLDLSHNEIPTIAEGLGQLTSLTNLNLSFNEIKALPESISALTSLRTLELKSNRLSSLPTTMSKLYRKLTRVTVSRNEFTASPALLASLPLLLSCNLSWNPPLKGQYIDWHRVSAEYKPKKVFISSQILQRRILQAVDRLDGQIASAAPVPPTSSLYYAKGEISTGFGDEDDADLADLRGFVADDNPETAATSAAALKDAKKKRSKGIKKFKQVMAWQAQLRSHLNEFSFRAQLTGDALKVAGSTASAQQAGDSDLKANQRLAALVMPSITDVKQGQYNRLNAHLYSLFKSLDKARGGTPIGLSWQEALQSSGSELLEDKQCAPVLASLSVGAEYQDSIEALQYLINEIDALLMLDELRLLLSNHAAKASQLRVLTSEEEAITNVAPSVQALLGAISATAKQSVVDKPGGVSIRDINLPLSSKRPTSQKAVSLKFVEEEQTDNFGEESEQPVGDALNCSVSPTKDDFEVNMPVKVTPSAKDTAGFESEPRSKENKGAAAELESRKETAESNLDVLARNVQLSVQARREQARLADEAAKLAKTISDTIDQVQKPALLTDFAGLPYLAYLAVSVEGVFPGHNANKETLLSQLVECCLHLGKALLLRCDALRDAAREVEVRASLSISYLDVSQRRGDDFLDLMADAHEELAEAVKAKESVGGSASEGGKRKTKSIFKKSGSASPPLLFSTATDATASEAQSDAEEDTTAEGAAGGSGGGSGGGGESSQALTRSSTGLSATHKSAPGLAAGPVPLSAIMPPYEKDKELRKPIDLATGRKCLKLLLGHRVLTLMWASHVAEVVSGILKRRGVDPSYPRYHPHRLHEHSDTPEWLVHSAGKLAQLRARVFQGLCIYFKAIEEASAFVRFIKSAKSRPYFVSIIKLHLAQGNFMLARAALFDAIRTLYATRFPAYDLSDDTAMPEPMDLLPVDRELALLQAYMDKYIAQLQASAVFSSPHSRFLSVQDNGLLSAPREVPLEVQRGLTPHVVEVLRCRKEEAADGSGSARAQLEESREELKRTIAEARTKAINALAVVQSQ